MSRRDAAVCAEATGASPRGAAAGADLGGSSKYSSEILEGRVWRRVPCEQPLHMGQSILSPRVVPLRAEASARYPRGVGSRPLGERESGQYSRTRRRSPPSLRRPNAVKRTSPETLAGAPGRVVFSC